MLFFSPLLCQLMCLDGLNCTETRGLSHALVVILTQQENTSQTGKPWNSLTVEQSGQGNCRCLKGERKEPGGTSGKADAGLPLAELCWPF